MSNLKNLKDLFQYEIRLLHDAENSILDTVPKMIEEASNDELKNAFRANLEDTRKQRERLEEIANQRKFEASGSECKAAKGLIEEEKDIVSADAEPSVRDAGLIAAAQRLEHYKIASYGAACQYARLLEDNDALDLLKNSIQESKDFDQQLTNIAKSEVNEKAEMLA